MRANCAARLALRRQRGQHYQVPDWLSGTILGTAAALITIDGRRTYRPFHFDASASTVNITGLAIENGADFLRNGGGAIPVTAGNLAVDTSKHSGGIHYTADIPVWAADE